MTQIADRVREVSTSSSTGPMTLAGTVVGFRRFRDVIVDGATVPYVIENGAEWEVGYGSFTAPATLNRVTVKASSNGGALVDFSAGQKSIWVDAIADLLTATTVAVSSVNGYTGVVTLAKSDIGLSQVDNTSDANKPVSTATQTALNLKVNSSLLGAASGVATLGSDSKLTASQIPDISIVSYLGSVASQAAMLALTGQQGDWCIRTDLSTTWVITGANPSVIGSWTQLSYPTAPVTSVNGYTGAVSLAKADVGLGNVDNTSDANKPISTATQTALNAKQATVTVNGIVKGNGAGTLSAAVSGTDYAPATSGSAILKGNALGGFSSAAAGTDYQAPIGTISGLAKGNGANALTAAVSGTDYAPATSGSAILKGNGAGGFSSAAAGTDYAPATSGTSILKGNGTGGFSAAVGGTDYQTAQSVTGLVKSSGTTRSAAVAETDYVTPTGTGTLSGKTVTGFKETKTAPSISTNTLTLDCSAGNVFAVSLNANITTLSFSNVPASGTAYALTLSFTADGTARTVTWGSAVKWPSGTAPTLTSTLNKVDTFVLTTWDAGTTWYAFTAGQNA